MISLNKIAIALGLVCSIGANNAQAAFPNKPINLLTPFAAGGTADVLARMVGEHLGKTWGHPVIVLNKPGATGQLAMRALMSAPADGYTLSITSSGTAGINPHLFKIPPYDTFKDFTHVSILVDLPLVLAVEKKSPIKDLRDFIDRAKDKPNTLTLGMSGIGSHTYLAAHQFSAQAGAHLLMVPYKGTPQQIADLLGGSLVSMLDNVATAVPLIQTDKIKALAISTHERIPQLPNVPTFHESGVKGFYSIPWFGLAAPAGTPPEVVNKIQAEIARYFKQPSVQQKLEGMGMVPVAATPADTLQRISTEYKDFGQVINDLGLEKQ